jgi:hypothetical protein
MGIPLKLFIVRFFLFPVFLNLTCCNKQSGCTFHSTVRTQFSASLTISHHKEAGLSDSWSQLKFVRFSK